MDVEKHLTDAFGITTRVTRHAFERIDERMTLQRLYDLSYLVKAGLRVCPVASLPEKFAFVDTRYNLGLVAQHDKDSINVMTVIHGKPIDKYRDTFAIAVRIDREKHLEEIDALRAYQKRTQ